MKLFIVLALISFSVFADVTREEMRQIRKDTVDVMMAVGAELELSPEIRSVKVVDELGSRVKVKFTYAEEIFGERTYTYYYDLKNMAPVNNSWLCEP